MKTTDVLFSFVDESGHPHPGDSTERPVLASVCVDARDLRDLNTRLFRLKNELLGKQQFDVEAKASQLLNRRTFRRIPEKREFVEALFDMLRNFPVTVFAVVMDKPHEHPPTDKDFLPIQFRQILYRVNRLVELEYPDDLAAVMFDGDGSQFNGLTERFSNWLFRTYAGQTAKYLADSPFFVDSRFTPGIQVADRVAGVIRVYQENRLHQHAPRGDAFLSAVARYYGIVERKSKDLSHPFREEPWYGIYFMPERMHYVRGSSAAEGDWGKLEKPEGQK